MTRDLVVVGAGPAGISAGLWARSLELDVVVLDAAPVPGGQLHLVHFHPLAVPGFERGDGPALAAAYARQLETLGVPWRGDCAAAAKIRRRRSSSYPGARCPLRYASAAT